MCFIMSAQNSDGINFKKCQNNLTPNTYFKYKEWVYLNHPSTPEKRAKPKLKFHWSQGHLISRTK